MKKFILMLVVMLATMLSVNAQIATENSKPLDNTYITIEGGVTTPLNLNSVFPVNPVAGIKYGKEFSPVFALEAEGMIGFGENFYRYGVNGSIPTDGAFNIGNAGSVNTLVKATNLGLNSVFNLSNIFYGYKGTPRTLEVKANAGLGWLHYFGDYTPSAPIGSFITASKQNALTAKTAIDFVLNIGKSKAHSVSLTPGIFWNLNETGHVKLNKNYAQLGLMLGYTYHFKTSNGTHHFKTYDIGAMNAEIAYLNEELAKKPKEVVVEKVKTVEIVKEPENATGFGVNATVYFGYDSADLDDRAKEVLDQIGTGNELKVAAYASSEGSLPYNLKLSQRRADVVKEYLEAKGRKVTEAKGYGVLFGATTGRVAIITSDLK